MELAEIKEKLELIESTLVSTIKRRLNAKGRRAGSNMKRRLRQARKVRDI